MKLTKQQGLILFDIAKGCLYDTEKEQFAGYSKEDIMKLLNQIISQQDNVELITLNEINIDLPNTTDIVIKSKDDTDFWSE